MTKPLNIVFAGTPDFSAVVLESLINAGHCISAVYCQPDRRVGRGKKLAHGPVKQLALKNGIPIEQPIRFNNVIENHDDQDLTPLERLSQYKADLMIVVAYGLILPQSVLNTPKYGCINIHASLLPRWRGAAPIQRAIQQGDLKTGITIMKMDKGLDTGNMLLKQTCVIEANDTGSTLHDKLSIIGSQLINQFLKNNSLENNKQESNWSLSPGEVQNNDLANYAHKLTKAEAEIDWSQPAQQIEQQVRAFNDWPVCFTHVGKNRLRIWQVQVVNFEHDNTESGNNESSNAESSHIENNNNNENNESDSNYQAGQVIHFDKKGIVVQCGDGQKLILTQLQADGSRAMTAAELLNGKSQWFMDNDFLGQAS